jgi:RimK family alpha-L-glutamate ligase
MLTHIFLANNGIKMPKTLSYPLCYDYDGNLKYLENLKKELEFPFIVKENFGSLGQQIYLIENENQLFEIEDKLRYKPHIYQEYISYEKGVDYRLILIGNKVIASMKRINNTSFKANVAQGGKGFNFTPSNTMMESAISASKILGLDYCAIDFVLDKNEQPLLIEVNSNAYFTEIEKVTGVNISKEYAKYVFNKVYKFGVKS